MAGFVEIDNPPVIVAPAAIPGNNGAIPAYNLASGVYLATPMTLLASGANMVFTNTSVVANSAVFFQALGGLRVPVLAANPVAPVNGAIWYNSTTNLFQARQNGVTIGLTPSLPLALKSDVNIAVSGPNIYSWGISEVLAIGRYKVEFVVRGTYLGNLVNGFTFYPNTLFLGYAEIENANTAYTSILQYFSGTPGLTSGYIDVEQAGLNDCSGVNSTIISQPFGGASQTAFQFVYNLSFILNVTAPFTFEPAVQVSGGFPVGTISGNALLSITTV